MARTEMVKFRVTPSEKAFIVTQAGGTRQLSGHLRDLALRGYEEGEEEQTAGISEPAALLPASQRSAKAGLPSPALLADPDAPTTSAAQQVKPTHEQCQRWFHHRSGTYCGSCKTVPK